MLFKSIDQKEKDETIEQIIDGINGDFETEDEDIDDLMDSMIDNLIDDLKSESDDLDEIIY